MLGVCIIQAMTKATTAAINARAVLAVICVEPEAVVELLVVAGETVAAGVPTALAWTPATTAPLSVS